MLHSVHDNIPFRSLGKVQVDNPTAHLSKHRQIRIFIVEDEVLVARELTKTLSSLGYSIVGFARSGTDALDALDALAIHQPDLVLMDIDLPGDMDGIDATRIITATYDIPVIYLTAYPDQQTWRRAKQTRPFGYLIKPWSTEELLASVDIAISRHQSEVRIRHALDIAMRERQSIEVSNKNYCHSLSMTTHELKNFLTVVTTTSELLQSDRHCVSDKQRQRLLKNVQEAVHDMDQLLDDVGLLTDPKQQQAILQPTPLNLVQLCQQLMEASRLIDQAQHTLNVQCERSSIDVCLDRHLLSHIIRNLLSNALKYSAIGTTVTLHLSCPPNYIQLRIEDQGIGIPEAFMPHLFEMFQRGQNVQQISGSGIGLALVKRCVELQNGTISVQSRINRGTTFTVMLPQSLQQ